MVSAAFLGEPRRTELAQLVCAPHATESFIVPAAGSGASLGTLPCGTPADVEEAAHRARAAQRAWGAMPPYFRLASLCRFPNLLTSHRGMVAAVLRGEAGMTSQTAHGRVFELADQCRRVTDTGLRALRLVKQLGWLRVRTGKYRDPLGLVGFVPSPMTGFDPVTSVAALLAGNALLLVPQGPGSFGALLLAQFCEAARLPRDLVQVVPGPVGLADAAIGQVDHLVLHSANDRCQQLWHLATRHGIRTTPDGSSDPAEFCTLDAPG